MSGSNINAIRTAIDEIEEEDTQKDKYLTFHLAGEDYGIEIRYVIEIIGIQKITEVPDMPAFIRGVINLRGKVIPVMDVRARFNIEDRAYDDRTCIIVVNLDETEVGHLEHLGAGLVLGQVLTEPQQNRVLVLLALHVDEVDHDDAADVAQPQLACDLLGSLQVVLEHGVLEIRGADKPTRVDVDHGQGLGSIHDNVPPGRQPHLAVQGLAQLVLYMKPLEERHVVPVQLDLFQQVCLGALEVIEHPVVGLLVIDHQPLEVSGEILANDPQHQRS